MYSNKLKERKINERSTENIELCNHPRPSGTRRIKKNFRKTKSLLKRQKKLKYQLN